MKRLSTALALSLVGLAVPAWATAQDFDSAGEQSMLARINAMRSSQSLSPLQRHDGLDAAARAHSVDMAAQQTLTHVSPSSGTPADRVRAAGVGASTVAENVALHRSADEAHQALLSSDAHRQNMLASDITHVGLAALQSDQGVYVTQVFATLGEAQPEEAPEPAAPPEPPAPEVPAPEVPAPAIPTPSLEVTPAPPGPGRVEQGPVEAPEAVSAPQAEGPVQAGSHGPQGPVSISPGSGGTIVLQHTPDRSRVQGYWVYGSGRWWYYPMPPGARPGQHLEPDRSVQGPPQGLPAHPHGDPRRPAASGSQQARPVPPPPSQPQARRIPPPPGQPQARGPRGGAVVVSPDRGRATITISPGPAGAFFGVPPPPMTGQPTRAWRRAHRRWLHAYRRWLRRQRRARRHHRRAL